MNQNDRLTIYNYLSIIFMGIGFIAINIKLGFAIIGILGFIYSAIERY